MKPANRCLKLYMIDALRNWLIANGEKVRICIDNRIIKDSFLDAYQDPNGFVVLDISPGALIEYNISDFNIIIGACFNKIHRTITVPLTAAVGIYMPLEKDGSSKLHILPAEKDFKFTNTEIVIDRQPNLVTLVANNAPNKVVDIFSRKPKNGE